MTRHPGIRHSSGVPDPETTSGILGIIDRYGLPLFVLVSVAFLVWRGILRFGPDVQKLIDTKDTQIAEERKAHAEQLAYIEARRAEERAGRLEAEERLESNNAALRDATAAFKESNTIMQALLERAEARRG